MHFDSQCIVILWFDNNVQEGNGASLLGVFDCKLNGWVNTINVF